MREISPSAMTAEGEISNLSKLALACVVLPNSNADSEHIFSMLKNIQTEHRSELAMTLYAQLFVPNKIKIWNAWSRKRPLSCWS
jgi:hypothetical protein